MSKKRGTQSAASRTGSKQGFADYFSNIPITSGLAVIFRDGDRRLNAVRLIGQGAIFYRTRFEPRMAGSVVIEPDWVAFFVPLGFAGRFLFAGCEARDNRLFVSSGPHGYTTFGERRDTVAIGVRRRHLVAELAKHGIPPGRLADATLDLDPADFKRLRELIDRTTDAAPAVGEDMVRSSPMPVWEECFLNEFMELILPVLMHAPSSPLDVGKLAIVRAAEAACQDLDARCVSLQDMYTGAGVGRTQLWKAFTHIYGHSPADYLAHWRLNRAREALLDSKAPPLSVKDASLSHGFSNSGRFARLYRDCFGELPSATLAATKGEHTETA